MTPGATLTRWTAIWISEDGGAGRCAGAPGKLLCTDGLVSPCSKMAPAPLRPRVTGWPPVYGAAEHGSPTNPHLGAADGPMWFIRRTLRKVAKIKNFSRG